MIRAGSGYFAPACEQEVTSEVSRLRTNADALHFQPSGSAGRHVSYSSATYSGPPAAMRMSGKSLPGISQPHKDHNHIRSLVRDLERVICSRLDRIELLLHVRQSSMPQEHDTLEEDKDKHFKPMGSGTNARTEAKALTPLAAPMGLGTPWRMILESNLKQITPDVKLSGVQDVKLSGVQHPSDALRPTSKQESLVFSEQSSEEDNVVQMHSVALRQHWKEATKKAEDSESVAVLSQERLRSQVTDVLMDCQTGEEEEQDAKPWFVLMPSSRFRLVWDMTMCTIIAHDMAVVPVSLAFQTGDNFVTNSLFWPFLMFWTMDIPLSFITGYYRSGRVETRVRNIVSAYLSTWFIIDVFMVGSTWVEVWASDKSQGVLLGRVGKSLRLLRVMHTLRILRLAKLRRLAEELHDRVTSEYYHVLIRVLKLIVTIVWLNHFIACGWWYLGISLSAGGQDSWTTHYQYEDASLGLKYFTSLHWSLTQFTPAGMEVSARNLPERIFSVIVLLFAMVAFSSFVSSITAATTQLRQIHDKWEANFSMLRRYLRSHEVPTDLALRILHCVDYRLKKQEREIQESDVHFLEFLSKPLLLQLSLQIYKPTLMRHPFFLRYSDVDQEAMRHICVNAISQSLLSVEDMLFSEGSRCEHMFFLIGGELTYSSRRKHGTKYSSQSSSVRVSRRSNLSQSPLEVDDSEASDVSPGPSARFEQWAKERLVSGEWCCEICLWCPWHHCGTMTARRMSEVLVIEHAAFTTVTSAFALVNNLSARYAELFVGKTVEQIVEGQGVSDLTAFAKEDLADLVERAFIKRSTSTWTKTGRSGNSGNSKDINAVRGPRNSGKATATNTTLGNDSQSSPRNQNSPRGLPATLEKMTSDPEDSRKPQTVPL